MSNTILFALICGVAPPDPERPGPVICGTRFDSM